MKNPDNLRWQMDLSVILNILGDLMVKNGDRHSAERYYEEAYCIDMEVLPESVRDKMGRAPKREESKTP